MPRHTTTKAQRNTPAASGPAAFIGVDFHKKFSVVTVGNADGEVIEQVKLLNTPLAISEYFNRLGPLPCAIENCRGNEWLIDLLHELGMTVHVGNTYAIKLISESRCKTDKIDSKILMLLLAKGFLPTIYQATREERLMRERLKWRSQLVRARTQFTNRSHALIDKENHGKPLTSARQRKQAVAAQDLSPERQELFLEHLRVIEYLDNAVVLENKHVATLAKRNPQVALLKTIPGVGDLSALALIAHLGDIHRFKKAKNVSAYLGLVPRLYASSDIHKSGRITKQGPSMLRGILVQDAWQAVRSSKAFRSRYNGICKRRGKQIAIVATARLLAEVAYRVLRPSMSSCWRSDESEVSALG